ncbi:MAG: hypothetical protein ACUVSX_02530 [Aggregatilineales bacterium]
MSTSYPPPTPPTNTGRRNLRIALFLVILATLPFYCVGFLLIGLPRERATPTLTATSTLPPAERTATPTLQPTNIPLATFTPISPLLPTPGQFNPGGVVQPPPVLVPSPTPFFVPTATIPFIPPPTAAPTLTPFPTSTPLPQPTATTVPFFPTDTETPTATAVDSPPPPDSEYTSPGGADENTGSG